MCVCVLYILAIMNSKQEFWDSAMFFHESLVIFSFIKKLNIVLKSAQKQEQIKNNLSLKMYEHKNTPDSTNLLY